MRHKSKTCSVEAKFPLLAVEQGCLISKDADITVAFRVELPELFTVTSAEYEAMHSAWHKAIKVLPNFSIVHKQDWFISEEYQGKLSEGELSFLARSSERHVNVLAWSSEADQLRQIKNDVGSALALMECTPRHNTIDTATLYWAGIPGNAADFPSEESFYTFIEPALCFFTA